MIFHHLTFSERDVMRRNCPPQLGRLFEQLQHQALQIGMR